MAWGVFFRHFGALTQKGFTSALKKQKRFLAQLWFDKEWARFENAQKCLILTKLLFLNKNFALIDTMSSEKHKRNAHQLCLGGCLSVPYGQMTIFRGGA